MATQRDLDHQYRMAKLNLISQMWRRFVRLLMIAAVCTCAAFVVREVAGKATFADIRFKVLADLKSNRWFAVTLSWALTAGSTAWATGERYLRKKNIKRLSEENAKLQQIINPSRKSSHLTVHGETQEEDE